MTQSGLPPLRVASLTKPADQKMSIRARAVAERIVDANGHLAREYADLEQELKTGWLERVGAGEVLSEVEDA